MRQLASVQKVESLSQIPGADAIELAHILGWNVVVKRGEFKAGDLVVYCEVDALLPERPEFDFLRKNCFKTRVEYGGEVIMPGGFRIKTVRLRGQISQGICFPLSILGVLEVSEGTDVADHLGIVKYDVDALSEIYARIPGGPTIKKVHTFPSFIPRTDETRIQSCPSVLERHKGLQVVITEKLDGSSITIFIRDGQVGVCSRNNLLDIQSTGMMESWARNAGIVGKMTALRERVGHDFAIQGEFIGPKVQGNKYALTEHKVHAFSLYDIDGGIYRRHDDMADYARALMLPHVPIIVMNPMFATVETLVQMATRRSGLNPDVHAEGIVVRGLEVTHDPKLGWLSFKVINPEFCLKYEQ